MCYHITSKRSHFDPSSTHRLTVYDHIYQWDQPKVSREHLSLGGKVWEDWYHATKRDPHKRQGGIYSFANTHTCTNPKDLEQQTCYKTQWLLIFCVKYKLSSNLKHLLAGIKEICQIFVFGIIHVCKDTCWLLVENTLALHLFSVCCPLSLFLTEYLSLHGN